MTRSDLELASDPATPPHELIRLAHASAEIAAVVAANPSITPPVIDVLIRRRSRKVQAALASNLSTPLETLIALGSMQPDAVLANPGFALMLAADPALVARLPEDAVIPLMKATSADPRVLTLIAGLTPSRKVLDAMVENPATPHAAFEAWCGKNGVARGGSFGHMLDLHRNWQPREPTSWESRVERELAQLSIYPSSVEEELLRQLVIAGVADSGLRAAAVRNACGPVRAMALARCALPAADEAALAAKEIGVNRDLFAKTIMDRRADWPSLLEAIGLMEPSEELTEPLSHQSQMLLEIERVLQSDASPTLHTALSALLARLPQMTVDEMRREGTSLLAATAPLDRRTMLVIVSDETSFPASTRLIAVSHPDCPEAVLRRRASSEYWVERALIAANPSTPEDVRARLRGDAYWPVADAAASVQ